MRRIGGPLAALNAQQEKAAVSRVHQRVNSLGDHGRAAGECGGREFGGSDSEIGADGRIDRFARFSHELHAEID